MKPSGKRALELLKGFLREKGLFPLSLWCPDCKSGGETEPMYIGSQCGGNRGSCEKIKKSID